MDSLEFLKNRINQGIMSSYYKLDGEFTRINGYSSIVGYLPEHITYDPDADYELCFTDGTCNDGTLLFWVQSRDKLLWELFNRYKHTKEIEDKYSRDEIIKMMPRFKYTIGDMIMYYHECESPDKSRPFLTCFTSAIVPVIFRIA